MTAIVAISAPDAAHLFADTMTRSPDGKIIGAAPKVCMLPLPCAIAVSGWAWLAWVIGAKLAERFRTFDDLFDGIEAELPPIFIAFLEQAATKPGMTVAGLRGMASADLVFGGWHKAEDRPVVFHMPTDRAVPNVRPFKRNVLEVFTTPPLDGIVIDFDDMVRTGTKAMQMQREKYPAFVGGAVEHITVTRDGVTHRVVHQWPEDEVGDMLAPVSAALLPDPLELRP